MAKKSRGSSGHHHRSNISNVKKGQKKRQNNEKEVKVPAAAKTTGGFKSAGDDGSMAKWERKLQKKNQLKQRKTNDLLTTAASHASIGLQGDKEVLVNAVNPPKIVAIVAFHDLANPYLLKRKCMAICGHADAEDESKVEPYKPYTVKLPDWARASKGGERSTGKTLTRIILGGGLDYAIKTMRLIIRTTELLGLYRQNNNAVTSKNTSAKSNSIAKKNRLPTANKTIVQQNYHPLPGEKKDRLTFIDVPTRDKLQILDVCKTADVVVCAFGPECGVDTGRCFDDLG